MRLSVVLAVRNDDYGGGFQDRLLRCVSHLLHEFARHSTDGEIILVEWNPDPALPSLYERLIMLKGTDRLRIITVPNAIHNQSPGSSLSPMLEYQAKNAGIRRSSGEYILAMNPDIIIARKLHSLLACGNLSPSMFYRANRLDLPPADLDTMSTSELEGWCDSNWETSRVYWGTIRRTDSKSRILDYGAHLSMGLRGGGRAHPHCHAAGDFLLMHRGAWWTTRAFPEVAALAHLDALMVYSALSYGLSQRILRGEYKIYHQHHSRKEQLSRHTSSQAEILRPGRIALSSGVPLAINGEDWGIATQSFPECVL